MDTRLSVEQIQSVRLGLVGSAVVLVTVIGWVGMLHRSKWDVPAGRGWIRYVAGCLVGCLVWFAFALYTAAPAGEELPCYTLEQARARQAELKLPMLMDFTADWCTACHELREKTLNSNDVIDAKDQFICAVVDVTDETPANVKLMKAHGVQSLPRLALVSPDGKYLPEASLSGFVDAETVLNSVRAAASGGGTTRMTDFERALARGGWLSAFFLVFLAGIGASLTPCVYPLIPITIGVFGASEAKSRTHAFMLSLVYVLGIVVTYSALGVAAALAGGLFGSALQSPVVLGSFAMMFIALGLSSLGLFELQLPTGLQTKLASSGGAGFGGALVMGLLAGVIAAPCVGPILSGVLLFITQTRDVLLGVALMSDFALGMGLLFIILGTFSSLAHKLPQSGSWMDHVKTGFAIIFVAMGMRYLGLSISELRDAPGAFWATAAHLWS